MIGGLYAVLGNKPRLAEHKAAYIISLALNLLTRKKPWMFWLSLGFFTMLKHLCKALPLQSSFPHIPIQVLDLLSIKVTDGENYTLDFTHVGPERQNCVSDGRREFSFPFDSYSLWFIPHLANGIYVMLWLPFLFPKFTEFGAEVIVYS